MPASLPQLVGGAVEDGVKSGIKQELGRMIRPKVAEKIGFATGLVIIAVGYGVRARRRRLDRLESKLDGLAELERDVAVAVAPAAAG